MPDRRLLVDSDAFVVLAGAGLLDLAMEVLGFQAEEVFRLAPLPVMLGRSQGMKKTYSGDVLQNAQVACERIHAIGEVPDADLQDALGEVAEIDEGEALLYALLAGRPSYLLASGDKRAMRALCASTEAAAIREAVTGRVICLESLVRKLIEAEGVDRIAKAVAPLLNSHTTLRIVFSTENVARKDACIKALDSYLDDLRSQVAAGFLHEL